VAAVGPKILYPNGRLQEAGCAIDRDGGTTMVGLFADPDQPSFSYARDVHYCSGAALLVRSRTRLLSRPPRDPGLWRR
jgi:GT2 family glycosyltransferase